MSCNNNYPGYYNPYYSCPQYGNGYCNPCTSYNPCNVCKPVCNPCQPVVCEQPCVIRCPAPCPAPVACPAVSYITNIATINTIPSGGTAIPVGTIIPAGTTTVPAGTVTVINGYTGAPTVNVGGIIPNNGFFTIPTGCRYVISANICFASVTTTSTTDLREVYIYKVDAITGLVTLLAVDGRVPIAGSPTCVNVATVADFNANDRVFIAARQTNVGAVAIDTIANSGRLAINRVC